MAKRIFITLIALSLAAAAFAAGQGEQAGDGAIQGEKLVLKGTVSLQDLPHPVLTSGDKQYVLMVPPCLVDRAGVKDGAQVTVQGYQLRTKPFFGAGGDKKYIGLFVTQATIDGKDYDLSRYYADGMMGARGRGWGMMGGRGPGYGMMGGGYGSGYGRGWGMMGGRGQGYGPGPGCGPFGPGGDGDD